MIVYLARAIQAFVMYCFIGTSRSSLLIESTDSMIIIYKYIYTDSEIIVLQIRECVACIVFATYTSVRLIILNNIIANINISSVNMLFVVSIDKLDCAVT